MKFSDNFFAADFDRKKNVQKKYPKVAEFDSLFWLVDKVDR